ncbi:MAG: sigma-70 family RNA polymerase sigma factor [Chitinophagaceae bacterium]
MQEIYSQRLRIEHPHITLWHALKNGDRDALAQLFTAYYPLLIRYGSKICADKGLLEDSIQDLFAEIWQSKSRSEIQSVQAYLLKALKYKLYKKQRFPHSTTLNENDPGEMLFEVSHDNFMIEQQEDFNKKQRIIDALKKLSNRQREIIYLKIYQELSYEEISDIMNINYQVARNLMSQAIKALKKTLLMLVGWVL